MKKIGISVFDNFFFSKTDVRIYACLRISFGALLLVTLFGFLPLIDFHLSEAGWFPIQHSFLPAIFPKQVPNILNEAWFVFLLIWTAIISSFFVIIGKHTKLMLFFALIIFEFIRWRNKNIWYGGDYVIRFILLCLLFSPCEKKWSLDSKMKLFDESGSIFWLRIMQIHVAVMYFINGISKSLDNNWLRGDAAIMAAVNPMYAKWDLTNILQNETIVWFIKVYAVTALIWECLFPLLLFDKRLKNFSLLMGMTLHLGIIVFLRHELFGLIMLSTYILFFSPKFFKTLEIFFKKLTIFFDLKK